MEHELRKRLYNAFEPYYPLAPDHPFNVDIDHEQPLARAFVWAERLADAVDFSDRPALLFFSGLRGSGKSTELRRMAELLRAPERGSRLVAFVDAQENLDLQNDIDVPDVLAALVHGAELAVLEAEGRDTDEALRDGYLSRLWNWISATDVELEKAEFQVPSGPKLVAEMKSRPMLRQQLRRTLNAHINRFVEDVRKELDGLDERARAIREGGLVVVYDSLEKLRGTSETHDATLRSAERVFVRDAPWFDLPVPTIWTVPPALMTRARVDVDFMPMIKLVDRKAGKAFEGGYTILREIVRRRASDPEVLELLGDDAEAHLRILFDASGGYVRDLLRMLRKLALVQPPASSEDVGRVVADLTDEVVRIVPTRAYPWLRQVASRQSIATEDAEQKALADRLIGNNVVLRYQNREPWFDIHPALRSIPEIAAPAED